MGRRLEPALCRSLVCLGSLLAILGAGRVQAQRADVLRPNTHGDFLTTLVQGNRGTYQQRYWLVVDRDPGGLNCREGQTVVASYQFGDVVVADANRSGDGSLNNAISIVAGRTYLRISDDRDFLLADKGRKLDKQTFQCHVRANLKYIVPINMNDFVYMKRRW